MRLSSRGPAAALAVLLTTTALAGCAPREEEAVDTSTSAAAETDCSRESLETFEDGTLTIATDNPAYEPWFADNDPTNGKGYESAVGYAIAEELGFAEEEVTWTRVPFTAVTQPGQKNFDFDLNQVSITEERRKAVDFSSGYYDVTQAVVTRAGSPIENATGLADLKDAKLGAQVGTTSYRAIVDQIGSSQEAAPYETNDQAVQALNNGQLDGVVVDLPTAYYMVAVQVDDGAIVGQLPPAGGEVEQFGAVLDKDSPLTDCVSQAVDTLRENGTLADLASQWLTSQGAPELS